MDLMDLTSVANAATSFKTREPQLHGLGSNASIMATALDRTKDGYEAQW